MKILVTGSQGSGKTTQAEIISQNHNLPLIKLGDLIRAKADDGTKEGDILKEAMETGKLADDNIVAQLLRNKLSLPEFQRGFVIDGYPRRLSQLKIFDPSVDLAFDLEISDTVAEERLLKRGRIDDTSDLIKERLRQFHRQTEEVLKHYELAGILTRIDGEKSIKEVTADISRELDTRY